MHFVLQRLPKDPADESYILHYSLFESADHAGPFEEELLPENEEESKNPTLILYPWCPLARNRDFYLRIEEVVTVYDPHTQVTDKYDQLLKDKKNVVLKV